MLAWVVGVYVVSYSSLPLSLPPLTSHPNSSVEEVRIKIKAVGLNFADVFTALGMYDAAPRGKPVIPGLEFSGIVEEVGERIQPKPTREVERSSDGKR